MASPATVAFIATQGGAAPAPVEVQVTEAIGRTLFGFSHSTSWSCPSSDAPTPCDTGQFRTETSSMEVPGTIQVRVIGTDLPPGVYHGTMTVVAMGAPAIEVPLACTVLAP